jgi:hypothetical protein
MGRVALVVGESINKPPSMMAALLQASVRLGRTRKIWQRTMTSIAELPAFTHTVASLMDDGIQPSSKRRLQRGPHATARLERRFIFSDALLC